jgi:hypothetical protein
MARTASSCWQQRDASSARHASLPKNRCCDAKHRPRRARCRASLRVIEFAERQVLDVHGSGVLDAHKQRLQLLSARADVSVERADFKPAAPLRHLALALESNSTAPFSSRTRSDSNAAADDATRIGERRNA